MAICIFSLTKDVQDYIADHAPAPPPTDGQQTHRLYSIFGRAAAAVNMQTGISFVALISVRSAGQSPLEATVPIQLHIQYHVQ